MGESLSPYNAVHEVRYWKILEREKKDLSPWRYHSRTASARFYWLVDHVYEQQRLKSLHNYIGRQKSELRVHVKKLPLSSGPLDLRDWSVDV